MTRRTCLWAAGGYTSFLHPNTISPFQSHDWEVKAQQNLTTLQTFPMTHDSLSEFLTASHLVMLEETYEQTTEMQHPDSEMDFCHSSQQSSSPLHRCHLPISPLRLQRKVFFPPEPSCFLSCFSLWALVSELGKGLPCKDSSKCSAMLALQFLRSPLIYGCRGQFDYLCPVPPERRSFCS